MAHRYFKTKRDAERAAKKVGRILRPAVRASGILVKRVYTGWGGYEITSETLTQAEMDDILSRPIKRKGEK